MLEHTFLLLDGEQSATGENYISFKIQHAPVSRDHYIAAYMRLQGRKSTLLNADLPSVIFSHLHTNAWRDLQYQNATLHFFQTSPLCADNM